jgi:predicted SnoaL-like aldol condensation-catalyzing enzyme
LKSTASESICRDRVHRGRQKRLKPLCHAPCNDLVGVKDALATGTGRANASAAVSWIGETDLKGTAMSEANKANTVAFHKKAVFEGEVENAFRLYAGGSYRPHNPLIGDGMEGLRKFVAWILANHPDAHGEIKRVFADGDYVSHWHGLSDNPRGEAVVDIYRLEGGKVVEHWDVIQPIPEMAANNNTMF